MEADLGIDSIKRVEILGKLRDEFPGLKALSDPPEMMDALARARTLGVIVDRMASLADSRRVSLAERIGKLRRMRRTSRQSWQPMATASTIAGRLNGGC